MRRPRGSVLIVVMFVLAVLSLLVVAFAYQSAIYARLVRQQAVRLQLAAQARSGAAVALARLAQNVNDFDHPAEPWRRHAPLAGEAWLEAWSAPGVDGAVASEADYAVIDEESKLHVRMASSAALEGLGMSAEQVAGLIDWMDADDTPLPAGAEEAFYRRQPRPHRVPNAPIQVLEEIRLIRGFDRAAFEGEDANHNHRLDPSEDDGLASDPPDNADGVLQLGVVDVLTAVGDGRLNLNTAPRAVLEVLPISEEAVGQIEAFRRFDEASGGSLEDHAFRTFTDIEQLQGLSASDRDVLSTLVRFRSSHYRVFVQTRHRPSGLTYRLELLVRAEDGRINILQWIPGGPE